VLEVSIVANLGSTRSLCCALRQQTGRIFAHYCAIWWQRHWLRPHAVTSSFLVEKPLSAWASFVVTSNCTPHSPLLHFCGAETTKQILKSCILHLTEVNIPLIEIFWLDLILYRQVCRSTGVANSNIVLKDIQKYSRINIYIYIYIYIYTHWYFKISTNEYLGLNENYRKSENKSELCNFICSLSTKQELNAHVLGTSSSSVCILVHLIPWFRTLIGFMGVSLRSLCSIQ